MASAKPTQITLNKQTTAALVQNAEQTEQTKLAHLSDQGRKMALALTDFLFSKYFFGKIQKRTFAAIKRDFLMDMQFNLGRGYVANVTNRLGNREVYVSTSIADLL